ncbi:MAG: SPOR domain-containing protein [Bacteroidales bacterium]|nr:SPOR domain-containing protein [Bacteroidales bacterium]
MKILKCFFILFFINFSFLSFSQDLSQGNIEVIQDIRIDTLIKKHIYLNKVKHNIKGWRIQIFFDSGNNSKKMANDTKNEFIDKFPQAEAYIIFRAPYYKIRVGDFRTKMDAQRFLKDIINDYPNAFVIKDEINYPKLD